MNLSQLKYVLEVEKTGSITKAAKNLYMGQPNLSKSLKEMEAETGFPIFERSPRGVVPTSRGAQFLAYARTIASQMDELEHLYQPKTKDAMELSVSAPRASYVASAFAEFANELREQEQLELHYRETTAVDAVKTVGEGVSDFAVTRYQELYEDYFRKLLQDQDLRYEIICRFRMVLMMAREHPLAECEQVPFHMLSGYTEIVHGDFQIPSINFSQINQSASLAAHARRIYVYDRGSQFELLRQVRGSYMWVSPVPADTLRRNGLVARSCALPGVTHTDILIYPRSKPLSSYGKRFLELLQAAAEQTKAGGERENAP